MEVLKAVPYLNDGYCAEKIGKPTWTVRWPYNFETKFFGLFLPFAHFSKTTPTFKTFFFLSDRP